mmetsp:Transcript_35999/g.70832  ORF Transcript_35999/g.70832 Transcript_35999/m.70832 type:complete len:428 (+) Transcript_35999:122-1405(+)
MASKSIFIRLPAALHAADFSHHASGIARLNNGSFGSTPKSVIEAEHVHRSNWRANPDAAYFGGGCGSLDAALISAANAAAGSLSAPSESVALVENASVATAIIASRWGDALRRDGANGGGGGGRSNILLLDVCYKAVGHCLREICVPAGGRVHYAHVPFPDTTAGAVLESLDAALLATEPRFVLLDHVSSQPALVLPVAEMVALCRERGVDEVAIDGAHAVGLLPTASVDVGAIGADFYYTNLHKWAFAPGPSTALHVADGRVVASTRHVVPSWNVGRGLLAESRWPGTRDFASALAVPAALEYLAAWRSADGAGAAEYNATGWRKAAEMLNEAWGVGPAVADPTLANAGMGMVRLPPTLDLSRDAPGEPSTGVRTILRDRYGIEAAVGGFGDHGGFVRLSHAVYNTDEDFERLRDAISELVAEKST